MNPESHKSRWLREPLVHFLTLGALLFAIWEIRGPEPTDEDVIVVDQADVTRMVSVWQRQWRRPPTPEELEGLVDSHIKEEVLYREALALGLDRNDSIVRRRMNQKMEFLAEDLATRQDPTNDQLQAFLEAHPQLFRRPPVISLEHVYYSNDNKSAEERAVAALSALSSLDGAKEPTGDRFVLGNRHVAKTPDQLTQIFGRTFTLAVVNLEPGRWHGPVPSGYGRHLVRIEERSAERDPELSEVTDLVRAEYLRAQRLDANEETYSSLLSRYDIRLEFGDHQSPADPDPESSSQ